MVGEIGVGVGEGDVDLFWWRGLVDGFVWCSARGKMVVGGERGLIRGAVTYPLGEAAVLGDC